MPPSALFFRYLPFLAVLLTATGADALEPAAIEKLLQQEIIGPQLSMEEVQAFTESRVPPMPKATSVEQWEAFADQARADALANIVYRGDAQAWRDAPAKVEWLETIDGGEGYRIKKLRYEALPGLWIPGLLYEPTNLKGKVPAVMNVNGHDRTHGKANRSKQTRCINLAKRGMLALNLEWVGMGQLRGPGFNHYSMNQLDLCGASGLAPHYLAMKRALDLLLEHEHADPQRVAVAGLSGGGWQTITISALDTRVTLSNPVAGYSGFRTRARYLKDLGDSEQTPNDLATVVDYTHLTAMRAPRPTLLTFNQTDQCCFAAPHALPPLLEAAEPVFQLYGKPAALRSHINYDPGTHNFEIDNRQAFYRMLGDFFYTGDKGYSAEEIPCEQELKSDEELMVAMPEQNADFHSLALALAEKLPLQPALPADAAAAKKWRAKRSQTLAQVVHYQKLVCIPMAGDSQQVEGVAVKHWRLKVGDAWTVPAVEFAPANATRTTIVVNDNGRTAAAETVAALLKKGSRVLAVDPFFFGESKIASHDFLFAMLAAAVGERPLGIQASQLAAIARWQQQLHGDQPLDLRAEGPRSSVFALVAAALEAEGIDSLTAVDAYGSLKEVLEQDKNVSQAPELFCFGLLKEFDLVQIAGLTAPRKVTFEQPSDRLKQETAPLAKFYQTLGAPHVPAP
ncbi:alpha/beta hydrolase family protein [Lignipirellula cremea]|uniref:Acetyl xylan esterase domain-containing protein n=1 Tax=Lignipirellula cremea TaxID=2528010 RepID=A0A518DR26_9BACT|nr:acetylxylan esterase [Lignipirellula cremea]QDU94296.1 hypothetical protein Pla8534_20850 [Lignipirellula cremea]